MEFPLNLHSAWLPECGPQWFAPHYGEARPGSIIETGVTVHSLLTKGSIEKEWSQEYCVPNSICGLVCHNRSDGCILSYRNSTTTQEVSQFTFRVEDYLLKQRLRPGEWILHPEVVELIWQRFDRAEVDLLVFKESTHCPLWFILTPQAPLGLDAMLQMWPRLHCFSPLFLHCMIFPRSLCSRESNQSSLGACLSLVALIWQAQVWFSDLLGDSQLRLLRSLELPQLGNFMP